MAAGFSFKPSRSNISFHLFFFFPVDCGVVSVLFGSHTNFLFLRILFYFFIFLGFSSYNQGFPDIPQDFPIFRVFAHPTFFLCSIFVIRESIFKSVFTPCFSVFFVCFLLLFHWVRVTECCLETRRGGCPFLLLNSYTSAACQDGKKAWNTAYGLNLNTAWFSLTPSYKQNVSSLSALFHKSALFVSVYNADKKKKKHLC